MIEPEEIARKIGWKLNEIVNPLEENHSEVWFEIFSKFGASGFLRLLISSNRVAIQVAHPSIAVTEFLSLFKRLGHVWTLDSGYFVAKSLEESNVLTVFAFAEKLSDILVGENVKSEIMNLMDSMAEKNSALKEEKLEDREGSEDAKNESVKRKKNSKSEDLFEGIGGDISEVNRNARGNVTQSLDSTKDEPINNKPEVPVDENKDSSKNKQKKENVKDPERGELYHGESNLFAFDLLKRTSKKAHTLDLLIGISPEMSVSKFSRLEDALLRNLRAKFDVKSEIGEGRGNQEFEEFVHRLHFICEVERDADLVNELQGIDRYFQKLVDLSDAGIDPLVFLGILKTEKLSESNRDFSLLFEENNSDLSETHFAFSHTSKMLERGGFDDPRINGPGATTAFVDVVLRHPGFSDKNMGQVLSILLSIEYHEALGIITDAPTILGWSVPQERAQMIKTVIDGAGGKVFLSEPGVFSAD